MRFSTLICGCALLGAATIFTGCSGDGTVRVSGKVTLDGAPVANILVKFDSPTGKGRPAIGTTDGEGKFTLMTIKKNDGALPGEYKVTVSKVSTPMDMDASGKNGPNMFKDMQRRASKDDTGIHENYMHLAKSPLKVTVPVKGELVLALKKDGT